MKELCRLSCVVAALGVFAINVRSQEADAKKPAEAVPMPSPAEVKSAVTSGVRYAVGSLTS